jgi:TolB-like protein/Flp pilus assembly protein TadD
MAVDSGSNAKVEIAHVLTMDVVEYSTLLITEQSRIMAELKRIVRDTARFRRAEAEQKLICLPTGDGMALVFFSDHEAPLECAMEISAAIKDRPEIRLRMGIHSGPVDVVLDVNERANVAGAGIDVAQRVMDCGDAGHILLSKRVADDLAPFPQWNPHLHDLGECEVKHGRKISLVNFYTDTIGNRRPPNKLKCAQKPFLSRRLPNWLGPPISTTAVVLFFLVAGAVSYLLYRLPLPSRSAKPSAGMQKSIAVLPFENLSHDPENAYFADGIQEEILTRLSKIAELKVISRTSTQRYKSAPNNLPEIAKQLGVAHVLEGTVQKAADQVRVHVQLINAQNDSHLWSEKYDRKLMDIFAVESEIATKIAETLKARLTGAEQKVIATRPTENSEAHQLYLKGLYYWNKFRGPGFEKSRAYFQQAIDLDPSYALAYAGLADHYGFASANGLMSPSEGWPKCEAAVNKALELDDTLAEAYNPLAAVKLYYNRDWPAAERSFRRGIELNPNFAEIRNHYAVRLVSFGRNQEALAEIERAIELDPLSLRFNAARARILFFIRQYDRAIDQFRKTLELDPNYAAAHEWLGYAYEKKGMHREGIAEWSKALTLSGEDEQASILERAYATSGFEKAIRALAQKRLERLNEKTKRGLYVPAEGYVTAYTRSGDKEQAFAWLAKAVEERNGFGIEVNANPIFDPLRGDPRFEAALRRVGFAP